MRMIDADKAQAVLVNMAEHLLEAGNREMAGAVGYAAEVIGKQRTIEAELVKHGWWGIIVDDYDCEMMKCSCCDSEFYDGDNDTVDCMLNYCPNCGAKMDLEG